MTHPFDEIAVEAAAKAYETMERRIFNGLEKGNIELEPIHAALSAAFKSALIRGMVFLDNEWWPGKTPDYIGPVTIIRHKENEHVF